MSASPLVGQVPKGPIPAAQAAENQQLGFDMLWNFLTGSSDFGGGPFDDFLLSYLGPITTSALNAKDIVNGVMPQSLEEIFGMIQSGIAGESDLYGTLGSLGQSAVQKALGGSAGQSADTVADILQQLSPLYTIGRGPITGGDFQRQQRNLIRGLQKNAFMDPSGNMGGGWTGPNGGDLSWGEHVLQSPFFSEFYGGTPASATSSRSRVRGMDTGPGMDGGPGADRTRIR
jgi:hypothetical protein